MLAIPRPRPARHRAHTSRRPSGSRRIGRRGPGMVLMIDGNVLNVALNWCGLRTGPLLGLRAIGGRRQPLGRPRRWRLGHGSVLAACDLGLAGRPRRLGVGAEPPRRVRAAPPCEPAPASGYRRAESVESGVRKRAWSFTILGMMAGWSRHRRGRRLHDSPQQRSRWVLSDHRASASRTSHRSPGRPVGRQGEPAPGGVRRAMDRPWGSTRPVDGRPGPGHGAGRPGRLGPGILSHGDAGVRSPSAGPWS